MVLDLLGDELPFVVLVLGISPPPGHRLPFCLEMPGELNLDCLVGLGYPQLNLVWCFEDRMFPVSAEHLLHELVDPH